MAVSPYSKDLYHTVFSSLKDLGVKVPKIKKFRNSVSKQELPVPQKKCQVFGVGLAEQEWTSEGDSPPLPKFVYLTTTYLQKFTSNEIGLFRKAGNFARQKNLRNKIERGEEIGDADPHDVASLLKQWLRELPEPLIPIWLQDLFVRCQCLKEDDKRVSACLFTFLLLPPDHLYTLKHLLKFLAGIAVNIDKNRMGTYNLALIIAPNIFINNEPIQNNKTNLISHIAIVKTLMDHCDQLGEVPASLTIQPSLLGAELKKKSKSGSVQDIFNGFRKLVGQTAPSTSENVLRHTASLDELDNAFESPTEKVNIEPVFKSRSHARQKSFGAFLRKKKKTPKENLTLEENNTLKKNSDEELNHNFILNINDINPAFTETKFQFNNLTNTIESKETDNIDLKSDSDVVLPLNPSEPPNEPEHQTRVQYNKSVLWKMNKSETSLLSLPGSEEECRKTVDVRSKLSRKEAFSVKPKKNTPEDTLGIVENPKRKAKPKKAESLKHLNRVCSHTQTSLCNLKCDKNKPTVEKRSPEKKILRKNNQRKSLSVKKLDEIKLSPDKSELSIKDKFSTKRSHSLKPSRHLPKLTSQSSKDSGRNIIPSESMPALNEVNDLSEGLKPQSLDLELSLLLQNFCISPPHESPEIHLSIDISAAKTSPEFKVNISKNETSSKEHKSSVKLDKIDELKMYEKPKTRKRLSSKSDSRIPRLKKVGHARPNSFSGGMSGQKNPELAEKSPKTLTKQSTRIPVKLLESEKPEIVIKRESEESLSCFKTPSASPEFITCMDESEFLKAVSSPTESNCKRESVARILQEQLGHVQAKVTLYDSKINSCSSSSSSVNKSESKGLSRVCSEKFQKGCPPNRPGIPAIKKYDAAASRSHSVKLRPSKKKFSENPPSKFSLSSTSPRSSFQNKGNSSSCNKLKIINHFQSVGELSQNTTHSSGGMTSKSSLQSSVGTKARGYFRNESSISEDDVFIDFSP